MGKPVPAAAGQRYDRRPSLLGIRALAVLLSVTFIGLVGSVVAMSFKRAFNGEPTATVAGFTVTSDDAVTVRFDIRKKPGAAAFCVVRARGADGAEVGKDVAELAPADYPARTVRSVFDLATTARAVTGEVAGCSSKTISKTLSPDHH